MKPGILAFTFAAAVAAAAPALTFSPLVHASRNATVTGELEALGGHPAVTADMFPDPEKNRLGYGRRS